MGITVGCLLGMFPLLFYHADDDFKSREASETVSDTAASTAATAAAANVSRQ